MRHSVSGMGVLYLWEASTILLGIYYLYTRYKKALLIFLIWLFASPLAASIALPTPHPLRSLVMLPIPHIFSAFGLFFGFQLMTAKYRKIATVCMSLLIIFFLALFLQKYVTQNKVTASSDWADGYEQLVRVVETYEKSYEKIVVTGYYWQPYAYFLFYKRIDPGLYQRTGSNASFDKYLFAGTDWDRRVSRATLDKLNLEEYSKTSNALIILSPSEYNVQQKYVSKLEEIKNHNGNVVFVIGELRTE